MDRAPGLPVLMFAATILGVSAGLPLIIIRGYQRYQRLDHADLGITYMAVCLFAGASLVGFGALMDASHSLLKDIGIVTFLGIGYAFIGSLLILPPLLKKRFDTIPADTGGVAWRYRNMTPFPRMAARYKLHVDPLLGELETLVPQKADMANLLEVGCGFGIIACWLADKYPTATIHGIEADAEKLRFAALALGDRGRITQGQAPHLPSMDVLLDLVIMLDVSHCLEDWEMKKTLERIHERLLPGGLLIMRSIMKPPASPHWLWHRTHLLFKKKGGCDCYRGQASLLSMLAKCGFETVTTGTSGKRAERYWHVAKPR
jgi:ubiquinone/menaquinone biosynthesis C-methylase UbiE